MILVGLAGWGDHDSLYPQGTSPKDKLREYSIHFPVVEVDSTFYAIQTPDRFARWSAETPDSFRFIVKAFQGMTGHQRGAVSADNADAMYAAFRESLRPIVGTGKLTAALFQYPPWFDCAKENVRTLRDTKERMDGIPCALEFRHQSWFAPEYREKTLAFMQEEGWIHSICDEPQAGIGSVPTVLQATDPEVTIIRMHGRNVSGWNQSSAPNWREVRYLYQYNQQELTEWTAHIDQLKQHTKQICVIFNNNSGGHAACNAKELMTMLGLETPDIAPPPTQLDLFSP
ncbi:hypothetical protein SD71_05690 [Cohnella kolymensis]|uniref:DUF72 domain-containing protein n=1 Tax=Cohnella kolymensis TaxID=1590652 RepID=A0ABR5A902_9BACL|nr:DUF72 domain-containing protein [Cohnella kolymensis]KIL36882.1 hypothetical protein SD71_05690 [Cohnella kolymensis]